MKIDLDQVSVLGEGLFRPEGIMALDDGSLFTADARGGCMHIAPDGKQTLIGRLGGVPNGICIDPEGAVIVANIGNGEVQRLTADGRHEVLATRVEGRIMRAPNFPYIDRQRRLWVTNSTEHEDINFVLQHPQPDGCVFVITESGIKIVADGLYFANGVTLDMEEKYLYVAESTARRIVRFPITAGNQLGDLEVYGPSDLGPIGFPDGIAFDCARNLWVTFPVWNSVGYINTEGELIMALSDPQRRVLQRPTNICFGGRDRKTAFLGSLDGRSVPYFEVPHPGMPLIHQLK